ncbi:hypothetical protein C8J34_1011226 [Rhizobium sp. PP-F2F-G36]|nr:hypothetical protein C8J34_1011226 [Rhizobium sp. PP-F2F-G36]
MRSLRQWKWNILKPYNGFTNQERIHVWQLQSWFTDNGWWEKPKVCSITGRTDRVAWHSEDYYNWPQSSFPIQQGIHLTLHARFRNPKAWLDIVSQHTVTGDEWFVRLSLDPVDLAAQLRAEHGPQIADLFARAPVPAGTIIPQHQIYREE